MAGVWSPTLGDEWTFGVIGGVFSIPLTVAAYTTTASELSPPSVFLGGALAGYLAKRETGRADGVGVRAGLIGATPLPLLGFDVFAAVATIAGPPGFRAFGVVLTILVVAIAFWMSAAVGGIGSLFGRWIAESDGERGRRTAEG